MATNMSITICLIKSAASPFIGFSLPHIFDSSLSQAFYHRTCGYRHQAQENPFEGEQVEEGVDPLEEKVESNISAPTWPQVGQTT